MIYKIQRENQIHIIRIKRTTWLRTRNKAETDMQNSFKIKMIIKLGKFDKEKLSNQIMVKL